MEGNTEAGPLRATTRARGTLRRRTLARKHSSTPKHCRPRTRATRRVSGAHTTKPSRPPHLSTRHKQKGKPGEPLPRQPPEEADFPRASPAADMASPNGQPKETTQAADRTLTSARWLPLVQSLEGTRRQTTMPPAPPRRRPGLKHNTKCMRAP